jgi:vacuolar iron transporter family protein
MSPTLLRLVVVAAFVVPCSSLGRPHSPALTRCLRCRGGAGLGSSPQAAGAGQPSVIRAAQKLCAGPGLVASSGSPSGGFNIANHVRGVVFGGMDGILTTFALLAAAAGTRTSSALTLVIGISTVLADALSMAAGEYLSAKAEEELLGSTFRRADDEPHPIEKGLAIFVAFTLFGSMPLLGFVITAMLDRGSEHSFQLSIAITASTLFALGGIKTSFGVGVWWKSGLEVTIIGGAAACVAYFTAQVVDYLMQGSMLA